MGFSTVHRKLLCVCADEDFEAAKEAVDDMKSSYESLRDKCTEEELPELEKIVSETLLVIVHQFYTKERILILATEICGRPPFLQVGLKLEEIKAAFEQLEEMAIED